jgi:hypothetical protein
MASDYRRKLNNGPNEDDKLGEELRYIPGKVIMAQDLPNGDRRDVLVTSDPISKLSVWVDNEKYPKEVGTVFYADTFDALFPIMGRKLSKIVGQMIPESSMRLLQHQIVDV